MRRIKGPRYSHLQIGLLALGITLVATYLGFTKAIPFRHHFQIEAVFETSNNLHPNSFVRIAGVNVGKVTSVEHLRKGSDQVLVKMRIDKKGRPIHRDATATIRPRIFLEGNFFVDLKPGTPSAPVLDDGDRIPVQQTAAPVQLDQILTTLQADTRANLRKVLDELSTALNGAGGIGFNKSIAYWKDAYKGSAQTNDASLGTRPHDLSGYVRGQAAVAEALDTHPEQLKSLITDFNTTAAAFAAEQRNLEAAVAELPRTLNAGRPALAALNASFPPLRRLIVDLRPAVRSSGPALEAGIPFATQARGLVSKRELGGLVADLRPATPSLYSLTQRTIPLLGQLRLASSCQNEVILPWSRDRIQDPNFPATGPVYEEAVKFLPGIAGESRSGDANGQWFRVLGQNGLNIYQFTSGVFGTTNLPLQGTNPPAMNRPPLRPNVACETQQTPDLRTLVGPVPTATKANMNLPSVRAKRGLSTARALEWLRAELTRQGYLQRAREVTASVVKAVAKLTPAQVKALLRDVRAELPNARPRGALARALRQGAQR